MTDDGAATRRAAVLRPPEAGALHGRAVFLSASAPSPERAEAFRRLPDADREIEQAVVALARAVFSAGGRLIFGGHPTIAPLVGMVAREFQDRGTTESDTRTGETREPETRPVLVHQLDVYRPEPERPNATALLEQAGAAEVRWHPTRADEVTRAWPPGEPAYPASLSAMRRDMVEDAAIVAVVCIGGMEGTIEEAVLASRVRRRPVYVVAATGGAAGLLARGQAPRLPGLDVDPNELPVVAIDESALADLRPQLRDTNGEFYDAPPRFTPYPFIMQALVERVLQDDGGRAP